MAKVDKKHFENDEAYINGMEHMYDIIKRILELSLEERTSRFGSPNLPTILDKFDFAQLRERMVERIEKKYVIRGITINDYHQKKVAVESDPLDIKPDETLINAFLNCHKNKNISFAVVETIYVRE